MPSRPPSHHPTHWKPPAQRARAYDRERNRTEGRKLIFSEHWRRASKAFLAEPGNECCHYCRQAPATMVDHAIAHRGDPELFWSRSNWRPACVPCNSRKAVREEGGFGHTREDR